MEEQNNSTTVKNKTSKALPAVPSEWPGAFKLFKYSKAAVGFNLWTIVFLYIAMGAAAFVFEALFNASAQDGSIFAKLSYNLVMAIISTAFSAALLASVNRKKISFTESFSQLQPMVYVNAILNGILVGLIAILSLLLFIVPFFFVIPRLMLCDYYIIEKNMGPIEALKASWYASKGHLGKVYGIYGVTLLFALIIITIIGIPVAAYLLAAYSAAFVLLYKFLESKPQSKELTEE